VTVLLFIAALILLVAGGELLVRGAARLAAGLGVAPLVIGLTVVAFGTSAPELAVSVRAALTGQADIAVGNVVGSNIFNVLFILGVSAVIVPLSVTQQLIRLDVPVMVGTSALVLVMALDGAIGRLEAALLVTGLLAYVGLQVHLSRRASSNANAETQHGRTAANLFLIAAGLALLVLGSNWLVTAAARIAALLGVSHLIVGLTIVAAGTSLPEVVTSIIAGLRGQRDIAIGNVIGSNIFNLLAVLGITGVVVPGGLPVSASAAAMDIPVMLAVAVLCLPVFIGYTINRWEGLLFLAYYVIYTTYLILAAASHDALSSFQDVVLRFVLPLTVATLLLGQALARRNRRTAQTRHRG
jgi:cation:H+ antiporter